MTSATAAADPRGQLAGASCPYRGLVPFSERDADYFFGRGAEREIIAANLIASRLTLFYAPSGVGKSSVLLAGVVHDLRTMIAADMAAGTAPEYIPVVVRRWRDDPLGAVRDAVRDGVRQALGDDAVAEPVAGATLAEQLEEWARRANTTLLIVLDQFEEFLLYHGDRWEPGDPAREIARVLSAPDLEANVLIALREDALAGLDRFKGRVPHLFENYLRLKHLDRRAAREAIEKPIGEWNRRHGKADQIELEAELVDAVLEQLGQGRVALARGGGRGQTGAAPEREIEAPFLQLVLTRVWEEERAAGSGRLRGATLDRLGGAHRIVGTYLDDQMRRLSDPEQRVASAVFHQLVRPSGTKIAHSLGDLVDYTHVPVDELRGVLDKLSAGDDWRILRSEAGHAGAESRTYEIFHDVLAEAVLDWRGRFEEQRAATDAVAEERAATRRRRRRMAGVALALAAAAAALLVVALISLAERRNADEARKVAQSSRLIGSARALLSDDPELAILLARRAMDVKRTPDAVPTMRAALTQLRARGVLSSGGGPLDDIGASPDGTQVVGAYRDGHIRIWDVGEARLVADRDAGRDRVTGARHSPDGSLVASTTRAGDVRTWRSSDGSLLRTLRNAQPAARSPRWNADGTHVLAVTGGTASVWNARTGALVRVFGRGGARVVDARWASRADELAIASHERVEVRSIADGRVIRSLALKSTPRWIRASAHGRHLAVALPSRLVVWDLRSGASRIIARRMFLISTEFAPRSQRLAVASGDQRVRIYDPRGRLLNILSGATGVATVRFSPDERTVFTMGADRSVRVWDARTGEQRAVLSGAGELTGLTAIPRGPSAGFIVTSGSDGGIRFWQVTPPTAATLENPGGTVAARFRPGGQGVITATSFGLRVWDSWRTPSVKRRIAPEDDLFDADIDPDGRHVVTAVWSYPRPRPARVFDLRDGRQIGPALGGTPRRERPVAAAFSPDGRFIATGDADGAASLWSAGDHARLGRFGSSRPSRWSPFQGHVAFVAGGKLLALTGFEGAVRLFDVRTRKLVRSFAKPPGDRSRAAGWAAPIVVEPGGARIAVGGADGVTYLYDVRTGARTELPPSGDEIYDLAFNPDGSVLVTAGYEGIVRLWDVGTRRPLGVFFAADSSVISVDISSDGASLLALREDDVVQVFACDVCRSEEALLRAAERRVTRELTPAELRAYDPSAER